MLFGASEEPANNAGKASAAHESEKFVRLKKIIAEKNRREKKLDRLTGAFAIDETKSKIAAARKNGDGIAVYGSGALQAGGEITLPAIILVLL